MKGVLMLRMKFRPQAECQEKDCGWSRRATWTDVGSEVRNDAQRHAKERGHTVHVDVIDRIQYSPDGES